MASVPSSDQGNSTARTLTIDNGLGLIGLTIKVDVPNVKAPSKNKHVQELKEKISDLE
jgi:hypothetical protein